MQKSFVCFFLFLISSFAVAGEWETPQQIEVGRFKSRAIWNSIKSENGELAPVVILVPGSGPSGPKEWIPASLTTDEKDASIFDPIAAALNQAGVQTLQLGKPGVEDLPQWDLSKLFYDKGLYASLHWSDLVSNLKDGVAFVRNQATVDPHRIFILGHSEGTQVAVDYAKSDSSIAGLILLGYSGEDMATTMDWQLFRRGIEDFVATDVDSDHDGFVTPAEAMQWEEFSWNWQPGENPVSISAIEKVLRNDPRLRGAYHQMENSPLYSNGIWNRGPIYQSTASLSQDIYIFTGALDEQTPPLQALQAEKECKRLQKVNCHVSIVPGLGHGFSPPKGPRAHPFLDMTVGPVDRSFLALVLDLGKRLAN
jgi:pimeloyl-ACP methyl ester carboxylesterase